jgi:hypothetical protein
MRIPDFREGVEIEFEVAPDGENPRWLLNRDLGYSGKWAQGLIVSISNWAIEVFAYFPDGHASTTNFPNWESSDFEINQWTYPGYLKLLAQPAPDCDCGCKGLGYHWNFCQLKKWEEEETKRHAYLQTLR